MIWWLFFILALTLLAPAPSTFKAPKARRGSDHSVVNRGGAPLLQLRQLIAGQFNLSAVTVAFLIDKTN